MAHLQLENVSLTFQVRPTAHLTWKDLLLHRLLCRKKQEVHTVRALRKLNIEVRRGERLGIIGNNGAGKSSLLKVLAGIYPPSSGARYVQGKISSLFDLSLGFEGEASGWENIKYRGYLQGETPQSLAPKIDSIAEFSELGEHLSMPVRYYSTGMLVRLAFSIATAIEPEILLVDEVLSAGDLEFQEKARARMETMMSKAHLMVMVSHDLRALERICDRIIWLDKGTIRDDGNSSRIIDDYIRASTASGADRKKGTHSAELSASL